MRSRPRSLRQSWRRDLVRRVFLSASSSFRSKALTSCFGCLVLLVYVGACRAATNDIEAGVQAGPALRFVSGHTSGTYVLLQRLAYFPTDTWQVGITFGPLGDCDRLPFSVITLIVNRDVELASRLNAFVGLHAGARTQLLQGHPEATEVLGPHLGSRFHLTGHWFLTGEVRYDPSLRHLDSSTLSVLVGFSFMDQIRWRQGDAE
jgi:hypothetical protein